MRGIRAIRNLVVLALMAITLASSYAGTTLRDKATAVAWTNDNMSTLHQLIPDSQAATTFVRQFYPDAAVEPNVGDYGFVSFDNGGNVSFVAAVDWSGREFYTTVLVIRKHNDQFTTHEIHTGGASIADLMNSIVDLHHDGEKEILVPRLLGPYAGATPTPVISDVYKWNGTEFEKANSEFEDYYANTVLPRLESALVALQQGHSTAGPAVNLKLKEKFEKEIAEVRRIINE